MDDKWMTNGILKSINTKDMLYKKWFMQVIRIMMYMIL